jgi:tripartite-type tricarboxylate transporter receptor subunit TctC
MKIPRRRFLQLTAGASALPIASRLAEAQTYPTRPITIVDTFPPGGSTGIVARIIADKFSEAIGQQVIVDQRPGAGGTLGARQVARSTPDGYTLMLAVTGTIAIGPSLYPNAGYDPRKDFAPVGRIGTASNSLLVHPTFAVHTVAELITYAKQNPGKVNYGSAGIGTTGHIAGELFVGSAHITLVHVPYRGTGPNLTDLLGGHIPMSFAPTPAAYEHAKSGHLRIIGVTSLNRSSLLPDVPTIAEQGLPGYEVVLRYGLVAPANTPGPIIERLNKELRAALAKDDVRSRFSVIGVEPLPSTPEQYAEDIDREEVKYSIIVKSLGLRAE